MLVNLFFILPETHMLHIYTKHGCSKIWIDICILWIYFACVSKFELTFFSIALFLSRLLLLLSYFSLFLTYVWRAVISSETSELELVCLFTKPFKTTNDCHRVEFNEEYNQFQFHILRTEWKTFTIFFVF